MYWHVCISRTCSPWPEATSTDPTGQACQACQAATSTRPCQEAVPANQAETLKLFKKHKNSDFPRYLQLVF